MRCGYRGKEFCNTGNRCIHSIRGASVPDHRKKGYIRLMERIEEKGLLLSEYPPGVRPSQYTFPRRNRLISAWSDKLIVIGAGNRSGAHIA